MEPSKDVKDALKDMRLTGRLVGELNRFKKLVAIGTSTGGPMALREVISHLPALTKRGCGGGSAHMPASLQSKTRTGSIL